MFRQPERTPQQAAFAEVICAFLRSLLRDGFRLPFRAEISGFGGSRRLLYHRVEPQPLFEVLGAEGGLLELPIEIDIVDADGRKAGHARVVLSDP